MKNNVSSTAIDQIKRFFSWSFKKPGNAIFSIVLLVGSCCSCVMVMAGIGSSGDSNPAKTPTLDLVSVQSTALANAWFSITQTAVAMPTSTSLPTDTPVPLPTQTLQPIFTATTFLEVLPANQTPTLASIQEPTQLPTQPPLQPTAVSSAVCSCSGDTLNCSDFSSHSSAQACYSYCVSIGAGDIHRLDRDGNGSACESLP